MDEESELTEEYQRILADLTENKELDVHFFTIRDKLKYLNNRMDDLSAKNQENEQLLNICYDYYRLLDILLFGNSRLKMKTAGAYWNN